MNRARAQGFSMLETLLVVAIVGVLTAISVPVARTSLKSFHLSAAVNGVTGAIQGTRYQAIMNGCPYSIAFSTSPTNYQVQNEPLSGSPPQCASTFSNVGGAIPWSSSGDVTLNAAVTLQISANGTVTTTFGNQPITLSNGNTTEQISVSGVGNVTVTP